VSDGSGAYMNNRLEKQALHHEPPAYSINIEQATTKPIVAEFKKIQRRVVDLVNKIPHQEVRLTALVYNKKSFSLCFVSPNKVASEK
jgi:hypothetical protein